MDGADDRCLQLCATTDPSGTASELDNVVDVLPIDFHWSLALSAIKTKARETVSAIAGRLFDDGYYENLRKAAIVVADIIDIIGNPGRNPNKIKIVRNR